jgi:hypothetical protein
MITSKVLRMHQSISLAIIAMGLRGYIPGMGGMPRFSWPAGLAGSIAGAVVAVAAGLWPVTGREVRLSKHSGMALPK